MKATRWLSFVTALIVVGLAVGCEDEAGTGGGSGFMDGTWKGTIKISGSNDTIPLTLVITEGTREGTVLPIEVLMTANEAPLVCRGQYDSADNNVYFKGTADYAYEFFGNLKPGNNTMSGQVIISAGYSGTWTASR